MAKKAESSGEWLKKTLLHKELGISRPTLDKYLYLPGAPKCNPKGQWNAEEVAGWIGKQQSEQKSTGKTHWESEKARLHCQEIEHRLAVERGKYVEVAELSKTIVPLMSELGQLMKQEFELVNPSKYVGKDRIECQAINERSIDIVIRRFRSGVKDLVAAP